MAKARPLPPGPGASSSVPLCKARAGARLPSRGRFLESSGGQKEWNIWNDYSIFTYILAIYGVNGGKYSSTMVKLAMKKNHVGKEPSTNQNGDLGSGELKRRRRVKPQSIEFIQYKLQAIIYIYIYMYTCIFIYIYIVLAIFVSKHQYSSVFFSWTCLMFSNIVLVIFLNSSSHPRNSSSYGYPSSP